jgi:hypothetical protein
MDALPSKVKETKKNDFGFDNEDIFQTHMKLHNSRDMYLSYSSSSCQDGMKSNAHISLINEKLLKL